ncbi:MAG: histidine phosphatase family protein [Hydrogenophilales bacterium]|nr:histidine phosphatase family protein [Hydrogenophilales bacterium]
MINRICSWLVFLFACAIPATPAFSAGADIWPALKQGGHVILIRHGAVDNLSKSSSPDADFEGCEGQYNLTDEGREQVKQLGNVLRKRKIPIGGVLASPMCRTRDSARIAFGAFRAWPLLEPLPESDLDDRQQRIDAISRVIGDHKGRENLVLITHQPNIDALTLEVVDPATIVVVKPDGKGGFKLIRKLSPNEWRMDR